MPLKTLPATGIESYGIRSVESCSDVCGFTAEDKKLVQDWKADYDQWQKDSQGTAQSNLQTDVASMLPALLVSLLVFIYHFATVRRETKTPMTPSHSTPPAV